MGTVQTVGVVMEHDLSDQAMIGLVGRCGYSAVPLDFEQPQEASTGALGAVLVRDVARLATVAADARCAGASVAMVLVHHTQQEAMVPRGVTVIPATDDATKHLREFLSTALGAPQPKGAVKMSRREQEVLTTYVMGSTVEEAAAQHYLATSTVRTHYRRATNRYTAAGRPVANKAHLLLQMVADGWIQLPERPDLSEDETDG
ncbi:helix-turn-helix transcriptional regulator [Gordonia alkaliphila]